MNPRWMVIGVVMLAGGCSPTQPTSNGPATLTSLTISGQTNYFAAGQTGQFTVTGNYSDGTRQDVTPRVTWAVQNTSVATVATNGAIRTVGFGSTTATATVQPISASVTIYVTLTLSKLTLSPTSLRLNAVGETSQLTLTAYFADGSTKDVSSEATWAVFPPQVASVVAGLATARELGYANITARYPANGQTTSASIAITPPGTLVLDGRTRIAGSGGLGGVTVTHQASGRTTTTTESGEFLFGGVTDGMVAFTRSGYEPALVDTRLLDATSLPVKYLDVPMQAVTRISAGESVTMTIAPHDMDYEIGNTHCYPCQLVRVTIPSSGTLHLEANWTESHSILHLWINGVDYPGPKVGPSSSTADVPVPSGEVLVYIGQAMNTNANYVKFTLTTSMR